MECEAGKRQVQKSPDPEEALRQRRLKNLKRRRQREEDLWQVG